MSCEQPRAAWEAADQALARATVDRTLAISDSNEKAAALLQAQADNEQAKATVLTANQAVADAASTASEAYNAYLACVKSGPTAGQLPI